MIKDITWKEALGQSNFRIHLFISGVAAVFLVSFISYFFNNILLSKQGVLLNDYVLNLLEPRDWSWVIFGLIYTSIAITVFSIYSKPYLILLGMESYLAINLFRMITLYLITLEPPTDIIPLVDPVITKIAYGDVVYLKDLFFSGHVSTLFLLCFIEERKSKKIMLLISTGIVAVLILWQHVHYTVDILAAPIVTWIIYSLLKRVHASHFGKV